MLDFADLTTFWGPGGLPLYDGGGGTFLGLLPLSLIAVCGCKVFATSVTF